MERVERKKNKYKQMIQIITTKRNNIYLCNILRDKQQIRLRLNEGQRKQNEGNVKRNLEEKVKEIIINRIKILKCKTVVS